MTDPYLVLGVDRNASDDEIKKAYRNLSRRYHPDANVNNPNKAAAEEKFKEVQQAYDTIMKERQSGSTDSYRAYGKRYGSYNSNDSWEDRFVDKDPMMRAAAGFIRQGMDKEAVYVLEQIPYAQRSGRWYYYSAVANHGVGNDFTALQHIQKAVELEPSNLEYRHFNETLLFRGNWYTQKGGNFQRPFSSGASDWCLELLCINLVCGCCCPL